MVPDCLSVVLAAALVVGAPQAGQVTPTAPVPARPPATAPSATAPATPNSPQAIGDAPAIDARRARENAVRQATDAFGTSIGRETIGLYSAGSVRGFSANAAGNARINGLYYDPVWAPTARIRLATAIRVGLSAQGFPFPAPTGVVDYALRTPDQQPMLSIFASADTYTSASLEVDAVVPITPTLSLGGGVGLYRNAFYNDTEGYQHIEGATLRWTPGRDTRVQLFWSQSDIYDDEFGPIYIPAGAFLPPDPPRRRFFGPQRPKYRSTARLFGGLGDVGLGDGWRVQGGLFYSEFDDQSTATNLLTGVQPDGSARQTILIDPPTKLASTSGEVRVSKGIREGPRAHVVHLNARARHRPDRFGGFAVVERGPTTITSPVPPLQGPFAFGPQTTNVIDQWTGGLAYEGRWAGVGEVSAGVQKTDYRKRIARPNLPAVVDRADPWLYNVAGALELSPTLVVYAGYTTGLEESGVAPENAVNRDEALPAIETNQRDAGIRWTIRPGLRLVAGVFDVRKPYFNLDERNVFRLLGDVEHRGVELSLAGAITPRLNLIAGGVFMRPRVTGEGVRLGRVGERPIGQPARNLQLNVDWRTPWVEGLSLESNVAHLSRRAARLDNRLFLPPRTLVDIGSRYSFKLGDRDLTLRGRITNLFNVYDFDLRGAGAFDLIAGRVGFVSLAADL
jgi:iron complex outermembrane recepter protein